MSDADQNSPQPPKVVVLSPTEMTGDWAAEVQKKLVDQGFDAQAAAKLARVAQAEVPPILAAGHAERRSSLCSRIVSFFRRTR
jgi:hypothetical protein